MIVKVKNNPLFQQWLMYLHLKNGELTYHERTLAYINSNNGKPLPK